MEDDSWALCFKNGKLLIVQYIFRLKKFTIKDNFNSRYKQFLLFKNGTINTLKNLVRLQRMKALKIWLII
jgi:hypothetical protein